MPNRFVRHGGWLIALSLLLGGCMDMTVHPTVPSPSTIPTAACVPGMQFNGNVIAYGCPGDVGRRLSWRRRRWHCVGPCLRLHKRWRAAEFQ
jgi:hypothetical protein